MKYSREDCPSPKHGIAYVILRFSREPGDEGLPDEYVKTVMETERLRPVNIDEWRHFSVKGRVPIIMFGNTVPGPSESGSFPGIPYLDEEYKVHILLNWARKGLPVDGWKYIFVSTSKKGEE
jgi:hypothetical protein